jgi:protein tyrosine/serine phosphatase
MPGWTRWTLGLLLAAFVVGVPAFYHRWDYNYAKRLRVVTPGRVYRSGQLTADGFADAVTRNRIRTVINLQDEYPDPDVHRTFFSRDTVKESELCRRLGVRYVHLPPDLIARRRVPAERPAAIDRFLAVLDDPDAYPVLIHCKAGLHRTGVMVAVYRMEYEGYSPQEAVREVKANGFGRAACTSANDYIMQYILTYRPGLRGAGPAAAAAEGP